MLNMGLPLYAPFKLSLLFFVVRGYAPTTSARWIAQPSLDQHVSHQRTRSDPLSLPFLRETQLYSSSSQGHLRIKNRQIDALGKDGDPYAKLVLESDNFGRVKIKGAQTGRYLCVRKDGRLTGRKVANKSKCVFYETYAINSFTEFTSAFNRKWLITVSKKGHMRPGFKGKSGRKSVQFIQRPSKIIIEADMNSMQPSFFNGLRQHILKLLRAYRATKYSRQQSTGLGQQGLYKSLMKEERIRLRSEKKYRKKMRKKNKKRNRKKMARRLARKEKNKKDATVDP